MAYFDTAEAVARESRRYPLLNKETEMSLWRRMHAGNEAKAALVSKDNEFSLAKITTLRRKASQGEKASKDFFNSNLRLALKVAYEGVGQKSEMDERVQGALLGLQKAVEGFDASRGNKFSTYAIWWIRQSILRESLSVANGLSVPLNVQKHLQRLRKARQSFDTSYRAKPPTTEQLAEAASLDIGRAKQLRPLLQEAVSLFAPLRANDDSQSNIDLLADDDVEPEASSYKEETNNILSNVLDYLPEEEREVVCWRVGIYELPSGSAAPPAPTDGPNALTIAQIAEQVNKSNILTSRLLCRGLSRLRHPSIGARLALGERED